MASSKKKRKNMVTLLLMLAVLAVLVVAYAAASNWKTAKEEREAQENAQKDTSVVIAEIEKEKISSLSVASELYEFTLQQDSGWKMAGEEDFPLDASVADKMADALNSLAATRLLLEDAPDLSEYGLAVPAITVTVFLADGNSKGVLIGDRSSADGGYYACIAGDNDVYLISGTDRNVFYLKEADLVLKDTVPSFDANSATGLKIESDSYTEFAIAGTKETFDWTNMGIYPRSLYGIYAVPVHVDSTNFSTLMQNYSGISLGTLVSHRVSDLGKYGLDMPSTALTVSYTEGEEEEKKDKEFTVYFGSRTEDGGGWYVRLADSSQVFEMDYETADSLLAVDTFSLISKYVMMVNIQVVETMHLVYGNTAREFGLAHVTETAEDGTETTEDYFTVDGKELEEEGGDAFRDIYQLIIGLRLSGKLEEGLLVADEPVFSIEFAAGENSYLVRYLPIEGIEESYAIEVDGICAFTADAAAVEETIDAIKEYRP